MAVDSHHLSFSPSDLQKDGPCIRVEISAPGLDLEEGRAVGLEFESLTITAIIDTGASLTVINPEVAATCKLRATGFVNIASVEKFGKYPQHAARVRFPGTRLSDFDGIAVVACKISRQPYACLIGRDILRKWLLKYHGGNGIVSIQDLNQ
jgi:hypothetical protein